MRRRLRMSVHSAAPSGSLPESRYAPRGIHMAYLQMEQIQDRSAGIFFFLAVIKDVLYVPLVNVKIVFFHCGTANGSLVIQPK